jgi:hypothetical protein
MNGQPILPKSPNDGSSHKLWRGAVKAEDAKLRAQELARSSAQENERQKKDT